MRHEKRSWILAAALGAALTLALVRPAQAQGTATVLRYNFTTPGTSGITYTDPKTTASQVWSRRYSVPTGRLVIFQLENVNPYFYEVKIEGVLVTPPDEAPPEGLTSLLGVYTAAPAGVTAGSALEQAITTVEDAIRGVAQFVALNDRIDGILAAYPVLDGTKIMTIQGRVRTLTVKILGTQQSSVTPGPLPVPAAGTPPARLVNPAAIPDGATWEELTDTFNERFLNYLIQLDQRTSALVLEIAKNPNDAAIDRAKQVLADAQAILAKRKDLEGAVRNGLAKAVRIGNGDYFRASARITAGGDAVRFTLSIKPNTGMEKTPGLEVVNDVIEVPVTGEWRIGFSGGLAFTDVGDRKYAAVTPTGGAKTLVETETNRADAYPVLLLHAYRKNEANVSVFGLFRTRFQPALSIGGTKVGDNPRYLLGATAAFDNRVFLTAGVAYGRATRLSPGLSVGQTVPDDRASYTANPYRTGYFISLTFRIGGSNGGTRAPKDADPPKKEEKKEK